MADNQDQEKKTLTLGARNKLSVNKPAGETVKQSFSHGRSKTVAVEVRRTRDSAGTTAKPAAAPAPASTALAAAKPAAPARTPTTARTLSTAEREARLRALKTAATEDLDSSSSTSRPIMPTVVDYSPPAETKPSAAAAPAGRLDRNALRARELEELGKIKGIEQQQSAEAEKRRQETLARQAATQTTRGTRDSRDGMRSGNMRAGLMPSSQTSADQERAAMARRAGDAAAAKLPGEEDRSAGYRRPGGDSRPGANDRNDRNARPGRNAGAPAPWRSGNMTMEQARDSDNQVGRSRSIASMRRRADKFARKSQGSQQQEKVIRDVVIPEVITVGELAGRMTERAADVVKALMKMGVMATLSQPIDADTAELIVSEFGHRFTRVAESDIELGLGGTETDTDETLQSRPPVVTIMGHVDHGKTSLLDAFRKTNVVAKESGGITQHIGAYQITLKEGDHKGAKVTFIDTPGHAAFTEMRARGANVTDIVIIVVAADDSIMPQTIEAIRHAKAAEVPLIIAINKIDLPAANASKVKQELLQYDIQVEDMGGETLAVEVSAKTGQGLPKLLEAIQLQAEILELKANPDRPGEGKVIEARLDKGRGPVATVLIQRGTLRVGDIFVSGSEWGRVRALVNDLGENIKEAGPAFPVEVLGAGAVPMSGDDFVAVENEARAREVADYRLRMKRQKEVARAATARGSLADMMAAASSSAKELAVVIKGDVHGSVEAIRGTLEGLTAENTEVKVRVLDASVGAISEADVNLAKASNGVIIGFNVRANPQARELARQALVDVRYYSIIYNIIDDMRTVLSGMLSPTVKENFIGYAEILQVFNITKVGKVAGCMVTEGIVRRGAGVRLLRDNVVIHEGKLKTLKRIKEEVKEVRQGTECGMAFENYENIQVGDRIECFETSEEARVLA